MELLTRGSLRIVHIEDDDDFALVSEIRLKRAGFTQPIMRCNDGMLALHYFSMIEPKDAPHVILLDLHMPHLNGFEVLHWLRRDYSERDVAVFLLTSSKEPEDMRRAAAGGATEYLLKDPLFDKLIQKLDSLIAISNHECLEEVSKAHNATAEFAFMAASATEMAVV